MLVTKFILFMIAINSLTLISLSDLPGSDISATNYFLRCSSILGYLGPTAKLDSAYLACVTHNQYSNYSSGVLHHDSVGTRLKLYIISSASIPK